jgi:hypothetical protein
LNFFVPIFNLQKDNDIQISIVIIDEEMNEEILASRNFKLNELSSPS